MIIQKVTFSFLLRILYLEAIVISSSSMDHGEEINLTKAARQGDKESFIKLYDYFVRPIYRFIYYKTHHRETAEDLTSQVFMQALDKIKNFNPDKGVFSGWLYQIARNCIIDHYRSRRFTTPIEDAFDISDNTDIAYDTEIRMRLKEVEVHIKKLTGEQRDIVIMRVWQEMSYAEIAAALGKTEASCKMMFARVIKKLQTELPMAALLFLLIYH